MRFWMKKYKVKKNVPKRLPKKSKKADLRRWSGVFFWLGLSITTWAAYFAFIHKNITYHDVVGTSQVVTTEISGDNTDTAEEEFKVLKIDAAELDNIINTIAYTHAVWPGYKGDLTDGKKVRKHFSENLAKIIVNSGGIETYKTQKIHFYYVVRDDGNIQYLGIVDGGVTSKDLEVRYIKHTQRIMGIGVPGIKPGKNEYGEPITVVYELVIKFTPAS